MSTPLESMVVSPSGWCRLRCTDRIVFAFELFEWSYHESSDDQGNHHCFAHHKSSGASRMYQDLRRERASKVFFHSCGMHSFTGEVFVSRVPLGKSCVRWSLPPVLDRTVGVARGTRWMGRHSKQLMALLSKYGLSAEDHLFWSSRSAESRVVKTKADGAPPIALAPEDADREYSVSTEGLLLFLVTWPSLGFKCFDQESDLLVGCDTLLSVILDRFVQDGQQWSASWPPDAKLPPEVELVFDGQRGKLIGSGRRLQTFRRLMGDSPTLVESLQWLARIGRQQAKYSSIVVVAESLLSQLLMRLGATVELTKNDPLWDAEDGLALEPTRRPGSRRCRSSAWFSWGLVGNSLH